MGAEQKPGYKNILKNAIRQQEIEGKQSDHHYAVSQFKEIAIPLLDSFSTSERIPYSLKDSSDLLYGTRRQLSPSIEVEVGDDKPYWLHLRQSIDGNGRTTSFVIEATTFAPDEIHIATILPNRGEGQILNTRREPANTEELTEIMGLLKFMVQEAPKEKDKREKKKTTSR